jgi:hypothetical protein
VCQPCYGPQDSSSIQRGSICSAAALYHLPSRRIEKQKGAEESSQGENSYFRSCSIYINWQCDITCPVEIPYEIEEDVVHYSLKSDIFKSIKRLALPCEKDYWLAGVSLEPLVIRKILELDEVIIYPPRRRLLDWDSKVFRPKSPCSFQFSDFDTATDAEVERYDDSRMAIYFGNWNVGSVRRRVNEEKETITRALEKAGKSATVKTMILSSVNLMKDDQCSWLKNK